MGSRGEARLVVAVSVRWRVGSRGGGVGGLRNFYEWNSTGNCGRPLHYLLVSSDWCFVVTSDLHLRIAVAAVRASILQVVAGQSPARKEK